MTEYSDTQLLGFADEALPVPLMTLIEASLREDAGLRARLADLLSQRETKLPSIGEVWRQNRLTCPERHQLGGYLLGTLESEWEDYIRFHIEVVSCRYCQANLEDLISSEKSQQPERDTRRERLWKSSAGLLREKDPS